MSNIDDAYQEAFVILTTAVTEFGRDPMPLLHETLQTLSGKSPEELIAVVVSLAQTGAGLIQLLADQYDASPAEVLQQVALHLAVVAADEAEEE